MSFIDSPCILCGKTIGYESQKEFCKSCLAFLAGEKSAVANSKSLVLKPLTEEEKIIAQTRKEIRDKEAIAKIIKEEEEKKRRQQMRGLGKVVYK